MSQVVVSQQTGYARNASESAYPNLWRGLVGWWCPSVHFRGGLKLFDLTNNNHGTLRDMANDDWIVDGGYGALSFDGSNDTVVCGVKGMADLTRGTISFWIRTATEARLPIAIQQAGGSSNSMWFGVGQNLTGAFSNELITTVRSIGGSITNQAAYTTATRTELFDNKWHHVAIVCNGEYLIYIDGQRKAVTIAAGLPNDGAFFSGITSLNSFTIGARDWSASRLVINGQMDDIRLYGRGLTDSEIRQLASKRGIGLERSFKRGAPEAGLGIANPVLFYNHYVNQGFF